MNKVETLKSEWLKLKSIIIEPSREVRPHLELIEKLTKFPGYLFSQDLQFEILKELERLRNIKCVMDYEKEVYDHKTKTYLAEAEYLKALNNLTFKIAQTSTISCINKDCYLCVPKEIVDFLNANDERPLIWEVDQFTGRVYLRNLTDEEIDNAS